MPLAPGIARALIEAGVTVQDDAPLAKRTWWRTGGTADGFATLRTDAELRAASDVCASLGVPLFPLGNASNLLVSDRGVRGLVVRLAGELAHVERTSTGLRLGGGVKLVGLVRRSVKECWTGLEMLAGVPGTVGGAVTMNAGTRLGEISDILERVRLVHAGTSRWVEASELRLAYRSSDIGPEGTVIAEVEVRLTHADPSASAEAIDEHLAYRARTQPVDVPTIGSTFRNPPGDHAGRLIDAAGLKGTRIGAAEVSTKHANFLINTGGATADDLRRLIEHVQEVVNEHHGVRLQREVHYAGDWSHWET